MLAAGPAAPKGFCGEVAQRSGPSEGGEPGPFWIGQRPVGERTRPFQGFHRHNGSNASPGNVSGLSCLSQNVLRCSSAVWLCDMTINRDDYYVIAFRPGQYPDRWSWEIRRKSKPLGIKMIADGFQSQMAAEFAGKRALANFLTDLWKEERRACK